MLIGATCLSSMWDNIPNWLATLFLVPSSIGQGLSFPATSLAVLATSSQEDQAVMTSTLILWRSLGIVMGVGVSSLILQNALTAYLEKLVTGQNKSEVRTTLSLLHVWSWLLHSLGGLAFGHGSHDLQWSCLPHHMSAITSQPRLTHSYLTDHFHALLYMRSTKTALLSANIHA
jgi:hypothetical protein